MELSNGNERCSNRRDVMQLQRQSHSEAEESRAISYSNAVEAKWRW